MNVHAKFFPPTANIVPRDRIPLSKPLTRAQTRAFPEAPVPPPYAKTAPAAPQSRARRILEQTCDQFGISMRELLGHRRWADLNEARCHAAARMTEELQLSSGSVGRIMRREASSVRYMLRKVKRKEVECQNLNGIPHPYAETADTPSRDAHLSDGVSR